MNLDERRLKEIELSISAYKEMLRRDEDNELQTEFVKIRIRKLKEEEKEILERMK